VQWKRGKARDPVCGMYVDPKIALTKSFLGATYYFCNSECADKFERETMGEEKLAQSTKDGI
jgi:YHS domain-containing protein